MDANGSILSDSKQHEATEKLLPSNQVTVDGSPVIRIRTPGGKSSRSNQHTNSFRLKRFDLVSDDISPHQAAQEGRLVVLRHLKENGESLEETDANGFTPLHHGTRANQIEIIRFLLDSGVDPNSRGVDELTPLHVSVR